MIDIQHKSLNKIRIYDTFFQKFNKRNTIPSLSSITENHATIERYTDDPVRLVIQ